MTDNQSKNLMAACLLISEAHREARTPALQEHISKATWMVMMAVLDTQSGFGAATFDRDITYIRELVGKVNPKFQTPAWWRAKGGH